jgi:hypothetical protein
MLLIDTDYESVASKLSKRSLASLGFFMSVEMGDGRDRGTLEWRPATH